MTRFLLARLLRATFTIFGVLTISFFVLRINGNPAALMLPQSATIEDIENLDKALGFDRPLVIQYLSFLAGALRGDLGISLRQGVPAMGLVLQHMPATIELALAAFAFGTGVAFLLAMLVQLTGSNRLRMSLLWLGVARQAIPTFIFAVFLILIFAVTLGWLPSMGRGGWRHLVLPTVAAATYEVTLYVRLIDSAFGEQRHQDYVRTAYAKGASHLRVVLHHMLPNALIPVVTVAALNLGVLLGGLVVIEKLFNWPGVGQLVIDAVVARDFPVVQAGLLLVSAIFVTVNFLVDLLYATLDSRVRLR